MTHSDLRIRAGQREDLSAIMDIWYATEVGDDPAPPPRPPILPDYPHLLATGQIWLAELGGAPAGFSGVVVRDRVAFLTDLFVDPRVQSQGVGAALLGRALDIPGLRARCTVSSSDHRALALYVRAGLLPQWPNYLLRTHRLAVERMAALDVAIEPATGGDPQLVALDAALGGRRRPQDLAFWGERESGTPLWISRAGERLGYAFVRFQPGWGSARIGPVGALRAADAAACALAAVRWASEHTQNLRIDVPGPHPALPALLEAGLRVAYVETFMLDTPEPIFDARRYLGSGGALF